MYEYLYVAKNSNHKTIRAKDENTLKKEHNARMRAKTSSAIAALAHRTVISFRNKLSSACKQKFARRRKNNKKKKTREDDALRVVLEAFSSERAFRAFTESTISKELLSRRRSEREYEEQKMKEDGEKSESEDDLLDDWVVLLDEEEEKEALEVAVVHVLTSAYAKVRRDEKESDIYTTEKEFFEAFNNALKNESVNVADTSFEKYWRHFVFFRNVYSATAAMQHRASRKVAQVVYKSVFSLWCFRI